LRNAGRELDDETFALQLMESSNLSEELSQLVISGINDKQPEIFEQTKSTMRKYLGSDKTGLSVTEMVKEKERVFVSGEIDQEQAYYTGERYYSQSGRRGGQRGGRSRGDFRRNGNNIPRQQHQQLQHTNGDGRSAQEFNHFNYKSKKKATT